MSKFNLKNIPEDYYEHLSEWGATEYHYLQWIDIEKIDLILFHHKKIPSVFKKALDAIVELALHIQYGRVRVKPDTLALIDTLAGDLEKRLNRQAELAKASAVLTGRESHRDLG